MQSVKKVEIIVSSLELEVVLEILNRAKVSGYTVIKNAYGQGDRGISNDDVDNVFSNSYILTVCTNENQLDQVVHMITPILKKVGGICLVSDSNWISH